MNVIKRTQRNSRFDFAGRHDPASVLSSSSGFTLIEVLVAIVILAVGLVAVSEAMIKTENAFRISQNLATASQIIDNQYAETELEAAEFHKLRTGQDRDVVRLPGREFFWVREVLPFNDPSVSERTRLNHIRFSVDWNDGARRQNRLEAESLVMNRDKIG